MEPLDGDLLPCMFFVVFFFPPYVAVNGLLSGRLGSEHKEVSLLIRKETGWVEGPFNWSLTAKEWATRDNRLTFLFAKPFPVLCMFPFYSGEFHCHHCFNVPMHYGLLDYSSCRVVGKWMHFSKVNQRVVKHWQQLFNRMNTSKSWELTG